MAINCNLQDFLKSRGMFETLCSFELESKRGLNALNVDIFYLKTVVLQGR